MQAVSAEKLASIPATTGDRGISDYEGNLSPGADRQAMLGQIKRFLAADKRPFVRHFVDREGEIHVETHIPSA
jgi:hypothetical protein